jgi:hypothetical protein
MPIVRIAMSYGRVSCRNNLIHSSYAFFEPWRLTAFSATLSWYPSISLDIWRVGAVGSRNGNDSFRMLLLPRSYARMIEPRYFVN